MAQILTEKVGIPTSHDTWYRRAPRKRNFVVVLAVVSLFGNALLVGPVRRWISSQGQLLGFDLSPGLIVPLIAILFFCVLLFIRGRAFLSHGERQYLFLSAVFVNFFLMRILVSASSSPFAGLGVLLSVGATLLLTVALASHEKYAALRISVIAFFVYLVVNLAYWWLFLDPLGSPSPGMPFRRMGGSLASVVHLGPLIPAFAGLVFAVPETRVLERIRFRAIALVTALIAVIVTGSRTGIALMGVLLALIVVSGSGRKRWVKFISLIIILTSCILVFSGLFPWIRLFDFNLSGGGRLETWLAGLSYWSELSLPKLLFGVGWGEVYPYWNWLASGAPTWDGLNTFVLGDQTSLVSPHNSFLWIVLEGGILLAGTLFAWVVLPILHLLLRTRRGCPNTFLVFSCLCLLVLLCISDVVVTDPGTSFLVFAILSLSPSGCRS